MKKLLAINMLLVAIGSLYAQENCSADTCNFEHTEQFDRAKYNEEVMNIKKYKQASRSNTVECLPAVLILIRDDNGQVQTGFDSTKIGLIFSQVNHHLERINARIYLADYRVIDSSALYYSSETNNSVIVEDVYGPLCDMDAINIIIANGAEPSFSPTPDNPLFPQAFVSIWNGSIDEARTTPAHEVGHLFGLQHTHNMTEQGNSLSEHVPRSGPQSNCDMNLISDYLCDTPADPSPSAATSATDIYGNLYTPDSTNIMSYYLSTRKSFTYGQDSIMADGLLYRLNDPDYNIQGFTPTTNPTSPTIDSTESTNHYNYLHWTNVVDNLGYLIERSETSSTTGFKNLYNGAVFTNVDHYYDDDILPNQNYWYRIIPVNSCDQYSNVVSIPTSNFTSYCGSSNNFCIYNPDSLNIIDNQNVVISENEPICTIHRIYVPDSLTFYENEAYQLISYTQTFIQSYHNVWLDIDNDGVFNNTNEWLVQNECCYNNGEIILNLNIPSNSSYGLKTLRFTNSLYFNNGQLYPLSSPCDQFDGVTIDYEINLLPNPCTVDYFLSNTQSTNVDYETDGIIHSQQLIFSSTTGTPIVDYDSGLEICLDPDFEVQLGAIFHAFIDGCGGSQIQENEDNKE